MPLKRAGIRDPRLERAFSEVPRERFLAAELSALDRDPGHRIAREGRLLQPVEVLARMLEALELKPGQRVLEIGSGVGFSSAVLSKLGAEVFGVEECEPLAAAARKTLAELEISRVKISPRVGGQDYDAILVGCGAVTLPPDLKRRLAVGGRLVQIRSKTMLVRTVRKAEEEFVEERLGELRHVRRLGDLLVEAGAVDREKVDQLAREAAGQHRLLGELLRDQGQVPEADLYRALAEQRGIRFETVDSLTPELDLDLVGSLSRLFLEHHRMIPVSRGKGDMRVATCDPDLQVAELAKAFHPSVVELILVTPTDYRRLWATADLLKSGAKTAPPVAAGVEDELQSGEHRSEARYIQLFESMLLDAIGERSSDIHLERYGPRVRVRMRVDGDLRDMTRYRLSPADLLGIVNVIKIRGEMDISERRLPQGGRIRVKTSGKNFDLRVQTQPSLHGEHVVVRLLPQDSKLLTIEDLGFAPRLAAEYRRLLEHPSGLVLVVGPTGSGKSTTLYAGLEILARDPTRKVITVEDPIEYSIEDVQQTHVRPEIGFSFAHAMRSFVRQDPDVILVGEIRDAETALEGIRASQTGHLVLSTLHCNDTTDAVQRLVDLGMHPNSIASELLSVISQRLARRICEGCRVEASPKEDLLKAVFPSGVPAGQKFYRGAGCLRCGGHGTIGRVAVVEFLKTNIPLRTAISMRPPLDELRALAFKAGLVPLRDSALELVSAGQITLEELPTMLPYERLSPEAH